MKREVSADAPMQVADELVMEFTAPDQQGSGTLGHDQVSVVCCKCKSFLLCWGRHMPTQTVGPLGFGPQPVQSTGYDVLLLALPSGRHVALMRLLASPVPFTRAARGLHGCDPRVSLLSRAAV